MVNESIGQTRSLQTTDENQIASYERAFYEAFSIAKGNQLVRRLWTWDDQHRRISTAIPYTDQLIFVQWDEQGKVDTALALNLSQSQFQADRFGFERPEAGKKGYEILTFFSLRDKPSIKLRYFVLDCAQACLQRSAIWVYATCTDRLLKPYLRLKAEILASKIIDGEERYHLRFNTPQVLGLKSFW